jgi:hypothetical protein
MLTDNFPFAPIGIPSPISWAGEAVSRKPVATDAAVP